MTIIGKINSLIKKKFNSLSPPNIKILQTQKNNSLILVSFIIVFSVIFFMSTNLIDKKNQKNANNLKEISQNSEFSNLSNFLISKINSPYKEINYVIKNNDTVEKILKNYKVRNEDINSISIKLKQKKLTNIYSGRKISLILKKLNDNTYTVVNFTYPVNNTTSVEIRSSQNNFIIKENILQLYKKEVVVKNIIKNNLYSTAINSGIEPNIIIEFARIFGFEVDFQRDIRNSKMIIIKLEIQVK